MIGQEEYNELLKKLISIESSYFHEKEIMEYAISWLKEQGVPTEMHCYTDPVITGFSGQNVVGVIDSGKPGPKIFLGGHLDTVELCNDWTKPPYDGVIEDGYMYGVGALDMKSGCAAVMLALKYFVKNHVGKDTFAGKILFQFASVEEGPFGLGTMFYLKDNVNNIGEGVDFAIITEPSAGFTGIPHPCICLGARGGYNYTIKVRGKSAHAATPELGINAIVDASKIVSELEKIQPETDDKLGKSAPCIIRMDGGGAACSVPDYAEIEIFHHTVRGENEASLENRVREACSKAEVSSDVEICFRKTPCEGFSAGFNAYCIDENNKYLDQLKESIKTELNVSANTGYFQSIGDFNHFGGGALQAPTVLLGPSGDKFHGGDERVDLKSALDTANVIYNFVSKALNTR